MKNLKINTKKRNIIVISSIASVSIISAGILGGCALFNHSNYKVDDLHENVYLSSHIPESNTSTLYLLSSI